MGSSCEKVYRFDVENAVYELFPEIVEEKEFSTIDTVVQK
jgi:hypothetical protein